MMFAYGWVTGLLVGCHYQCAQGGAIDAWFSHVFMDGSIMFVNSSSPGQGGALHISGGVMDIQGQATFMENSAENGGAIFSASANLLIAGGITPAGVFAAIEGATYKVAFIKNVASGFGGAMHVLSPTYLGVGRTTFDSNEASVGGAVYIFDVNETNAVFSECVFEGNTASDGGAYYSQRAQGVDVFRLSLFRGNFAHTSGGAVYHTGSMRISNTTFAENKAGVEGPAVISVGLLDKLSNVRFLDNAYHCRAGMYGYVDKSQNDSCDLCFDKVCARCTSGVEGLGEMTHVRTGGLPVCGEPPIGSTASLSGTTIENLVLRRGYYRTSNISDAVLKCFQENACQGGTEPDTYCAPGYMGPYCAVCVEGFVPAIAHACRKCSTGIAMGLMIAVSVSALLVTALVLSYLRSTPSAHVENRSEEASRTRWRKKLRYCSAAFLKSLPLTAIKIVLTVWQILSQFDAISGDVFPEVYKAFVSKLGPINLNMDYILSYSCIVSTDFYDHLLFATIAPLVALAVLAVNYAAAKTKNGDSSASTMMGVVLHKHQAAAIYLAFLVYSPVSNAIFQTFSCDELDDGNVYLRADYSLNCSTPRHDRYKTYAHVMGYVYPVGIALVFAVLLGRYRSDLNKPDREQIGHLAPFRALWAPYKPSRYYYEIIECGRRVCLTGIAVLVVPNSTAQVSIVLVFAVVFVFISEAVSPFEKAAHMNLYRWGNGVVVASMYVAFLMKIDVAKDNTQALLTFSGVLIAANVFMIITVLLQTALLVIEYRGARGGVREVRMPVRRRTV